MGTPTSADGTVNFRACFNSKSSQLPDCISYQVLTRSTRRKPGVVGLYDYKLVKFPKTACVDRGPKQTPALPNTTPHSGTCLLCHALVNGKAHIDVLSSMVGKIGVGILPSRHDNTPKHTGSSLK